MTFGMDFGHGGTIGGSLNGDAIADAAARYVGMQETGTNRGAGIDQMLRNAGAAPGQPWCAAAATTWINEASPGTVTPTASSQGMRNEFKQYGALQDASPESLKPGNAMFFTDRDGTHGHVGIIKSFDPQTGTITTIEGNNHNAVREDTYNIADLQRNSRFSGIGDVDSLKAAKGLGGGNQYAARESDLGSLSPSQGGQRSLSSMLGLG